MANSLVAKVYRSELARPFRPLLRRIAHSSIGTQVARSVWFPLNWGATIRLCRVLAIEYGHLASAARGRCLDAAGRPVPWYSYPAIEYLRQLDFSACSVFEYGAGYSTLFWASMARDVTSVEDDERWCAELSPQLPANVKLLHEPDLERFAQAMQSFGQFDVIVIDGPIRGRTRLKCARVAVNHLQHGGIIVLDNSDWCAESAAYLRHAGLLQVDMTGFAPINSYTSATSLFFHRDFRLQARDGRQPKPGIGARLNEAERPPRGVGKQIACGEDLFEEVAYEEQLEFDLEGSRRIFRLVGYQKTETRAAIAIIDEASNRVLLSNHHMTDGRWPMLAADMDREIARVRAFTGDEFKQFINEHHERRYKL